MRDSPLGSLLRRPIVVASLSLHVLLAIVLSFIPLFHVLGFERAFASGILATFTSPLIASSAVRDARRRGGDDVARIALLALVVACLSLVPTTIAGFIVEGVTEPCSPRTGVAFVVACAGGNALFGVALGVAGATLSRRRRGAVAIVAFVLCALFFAALHRLYREPQIFVFNHAFGYWPGSLYDEEITLGTPLWAFRAYTASLALSIVLAARMFADDLSVALAPPRIGRIFALALALLAAVALARLGEDLGFDLDRGTIERELSRKVSTPHFSLFIDPSVGRKRVARLVEEHEFAFASLAEFFKTSPREKITSFVYRNAEQKARLMGASRTQIARPWAREFHIHGFEHPHRILEHELAHVFAGELAQGIFRVPTTAFLLPNIGVIEGTAVAADWPASDLTVHEWAKAMRRLELAPNLRTMLDVAGFWTTSSARAYTVAGSFIRHLIDRHGIERFAALYASNDFAASYGRSLDDLVSEWEVMIDALPLDERDLVMAEHRFEQPSVFAKVCAHEAAALSRSGHEKLARGDLDAGIRDLERLAGWAPTNIDPLLAIAEAFIEEDRLEDATPWVERASAAAGRATERDRMRAREVLAGIAWRRNEKDGARAHYAAILRTHLSIASDRLQEARLLALASSMDTESVLRPYLLGDLAQPRDLVELAELAHRAPRDALVHYLYARRLEDIDAPVLGLFEVEAALEIGLSAPNLAREARAMRGRMLFAAGRPRDARDEFTALAAKEKLPGVRLDATIWARRAEFALRTRTSTGTPGE